MNPDYLVFSFFPLLKQLPIFPQKEQKRQNFNTFEQIVNDSATANVEYILFLLYFEFEAVQKFAYLVEREKCSKMNI